MADVVDAVAARRERLPPSASDPRLLAQCFFVALRLLWPHLEDPTSAAFQGFPGNKLVFGAQRRSRPACAAAPLRGLATAPHT